MIKKNHNAYSVFMGFLCLVVVYLHSSWIVGFDIFSLGLSLPVVEKVLNLFLMTAVPSFFFVWGYLSNKYLYQDLNSLTFWKTKFLQFYPLYLISFLCHQALNYKNLSHFSLFELLGGVVGVYYVAGFYGGNVYLPVLFAIITLPFLKSNRFSQKKINIFFMIICLLFTKLLPHESSNCYIRYFGYYTAFFVGIVSRDIDIVSRIKASKTLFIFFSVGALLTPVLNFLGVYSTEIQYSPSSPEQLLWSVFISCLCLILFDFILNKLWIRRIVNTLSDIGNNAYFHFMVHAFVIHLLHSLLLIFGISPLFTQIIIILTTSVICVKVVLPVYVKVTEYGSEKMSKFKKIL